MSPTSIQQLKALCEKAVPGEFDKNCDLCGTPVRVVGETTQHYESAYNKLYEAYTNIQEARELDEYKYDKLQLHADALAEALERLQEKTAYTAGGDAVLDAYRTFKDKK